MWQEIIYPVAFVLLVLLPLLALAGLFVLWRIDSPRAERMRAAFLELAASPRFRVIDGAQDPQVVAAEVLATAAQALP